MKRSRTISRQRLRMWQMLQAEADFHAYERSPFWNEVARLAGDPISNTNTVEPALAIAAGEK